MFAVESRLTSAVMIGAAVAAAMMAIAGCATESGTAPGEQVTAAAAPELARDDCAGVPARERRLGLLAYRDAVGGTRSLKESTHVGKAEVSHARGVAIAVRAQPGMSAPWLTRVAACHIAFASAQPPPSNGDDANDPLLVPGATVRVEEAGTTYIVSIHVPDDETAIEVARRTQMLLMSPPGSAAAEVDAR